MKAETVASIEILTACFIINFLYGGATRLASIFFVESIHRYGVNRKQASFPFVLAYMIRNLCGPLHGYMEQIFGIKFLVIFGNILATISIAACFFAENISTVIILWGIVFGFCYGLGTQFLPLMLNTHFTTNRNKANGFSYSGACLGGVILPPIMDVCVDYYGLDGSFLLLAGIMAHLIPLSFLLNSHENKFKCRISDIKDKSKSLEMNEKETALPLLDATFNNTDDKSCENLLQSNTTKQETSEQYKNNYKLNENVLQPNTTKQEITLTSSEQYQNNNKSSENVLQPNTTEQETTLTSSELDQKCTTKTCPTQKVANENIKKTSPSIFTLKNFAIFIDPPFLILFIMIGGTTLIITTMWTIILDFVRDKGVGANIEIYYVMIMPLADIFGRIGSGFVTDKKFLPTYVITSMCCVCTGLTLFGLLFAYNYLLLMLIELLFSLFCGSILVLQIALIHEFMQPKRRSMAMVCRTVLYAPLSLTISPMIGYFRGEHGSYNGVIYTLICVSFFCGSIIYFVPHLAKRRSTSSSDNLA